MSEPTVKKSVELAIETEKQGARFYERMSKKFADPPELASIFLRLASDEKAHEARFSRLLQTAPADDPLVENEYGRSEYLRALAISEFIKGDALEAMQQQDNLVDVLQTAVELERATLNFYQGLRDELGDHELLGALIKEEKSHIVSLVGLIEKHRA